MKGVYWILGCDADAGRISDKSYYYTIIQSKMARDVYFQQMYTYMHICIASSQRRLRLREPEGTTQRIKPERRGSRSRGRAEPKQSRVEESKEVEERAMCRCIYSQG